MAVLLTDDRPELAPTASRQPVGAGSPAAVSVVIPTRDRADRIERGVRAVLADPATTEVVVVDDGSTDATPGRLRALAETDRRLRVVRTSGRGRSPARQLGVEAATGPVVLLLDDDVVAHPGMVTGHRDRHEAADAGDLVVVGYMPTTVPERRRAGDAMTRLYAAEYEARAARWREHSSDVLENLWLGNVSALRVAWLEVGIDDGHFPASHHEDQDLGLRMRAHGLRGVFDPSLRADHEHQRTLEQFLVDSYQQGLGRHAVSHRHGVPALDVIALGSDLPPSLRTLVAVADSSPCGPALERLLRDTAVLAGNLHAWPVEDAASRLLRRIALRRGAMDGART